MPTYGRLPRFVRDWEALTPAQQALFLVAVKVFVEDLHKGSGFRPGLRVKKMKGHVSVWEMSWAPDAVRRSNTATPWPKGSRT